NTTLGYATTVSTMARRSETRPCRARIAASTDGPSRPSSTHAEQVDHEHERLVGTDDPARARLAVGEVRGDDEAASATNPHADHSLVPALDHLARAQRERERLAPIPRGVELTSCRPAVADVVD